MNKASLFALEYRLELISKADRLESLDCQHDFCRGFLFALLSASVVSDSEFDDLSDRVSLAVIEARERICRVVTDSAADLLVGVDNEEPEQVSAPAASFGLSVRRLRYTNFYTHIEHLNPKTWCPYGVWLGIWSLKTMPAGWPSLPGRRSLVGGQGQVCMSSGQASS
ncbi:hypothetical protein D3C78_356550 [compost metagenome]